jgi:hypothetical protein
MTATTNTTTQFFTKRSNRAVKKVSEFEFIVEKDQAIGMGGSCEDLPRREPR